MKTIIVPIDFSGDSINALEHAIKIANTVDANLRMVHVQKSNQFKVPKYFVDFNKMYSNDVHDYFKVLIDKYSKKIKTKFDYVLRQGKVYKEVVDQTKEDNAYMIVCGTHGISGFEEFWIGSNAYRIVSNAECPVLTIRNGYLKKSISKIVLPIDMTSESRQKTNFTVELAKFFDAEIHVVSVKETNTPAVINRIEKYVVQTTDYIKEKGIKCVNDSLFGSNITESTIEYAISVDAELISIMTEQVASTKNLWLGKYAQQMVNHSPIPVLSNHVKIKK